MFSRTIIGITLLLLPLGLSFDHILLPAENADTEIAICASEYIHFSINSSSSPFSTILLTERPSKIIENTIKLLHSENLPVEIIDVRSFELNDDGPCANKNYFWFHSPSELSSFLLIFNCKCANASVHIIALGEGIDLEQLQTHLQTCNGGVFHSMHSDLWRIVSLKSPNEEEGVEQFSCSHTQDTSLPSDEEEPGATIEQNFFNADVVGNDSELFVYSLDSPPYTIYDSRHGFYDGIEYFALREIAKALNMTIRFELLDAAFDIKALVNYMNFLRWLKFVRR